MLDSIWQLLKSIWAALDKAGALANLLTFIGALAPIVGMSIAS